MSMYDKKPLQYCKVISLQLIKINGKKNNVKELTNLQITPSNEAKQQLDLNLREFHPYWTFRIPN